MTKNLCQNISDMFLVCTGLYCTEFTRNIAKLAIGGCGQITTNKI